jgi:outer membrane protein W
MLTTERAPAAARALRWIAAIAIVAAGLAPHASAAASGKGDYIGVGSFGAALGYAVPNTDQYSDVATWRLTAGYSPVPQFEVDFEIGRFTTVVRQPEADGVPTHTIASGELEILPVCLTAQYRTPMPELLSTLSLLAGVGYYFIDYAMAEKPRGAFEDAGVPGLPDQSVDNAWGVHFGGGLEYALSERLSLTGEVRYLFLAPEARGTTADGGRFSGTLDLNTWLFSGGVKIVF